MYNFYDVWNFEFFSMQFCDFQAYLAQTLRDSKLDLYSVLVGLSEEFDMISIVK